MANKNINKNPKQKEKMVLAKDKNQLILAGIVVALFIGVTIYNIASYIISQNPPTAPATTGNEQQLMDQKGKGPDFATDPNSPSAAATNSMAPGPSQATATNSVAPGSPQATDPNAPPAQPSGLSDKNPQANPTQPAQASAPPVQAASGGTPIIPILVVLLIAALVYALIKFSKSDSNNFNQGSNKGNKKGSAPGGGKFVLAKNKNELILAGAVIGVFLIYTIYNISMYIKDQQVASAPPTSQDSQAAQMAKSQQQNLESLNQDQSTQNTAVSGDMGANPQNVQADANDIYSKTLEMQGKTPGLPPQTAGMQSTQGNGDEVEIMSKNRLRARSGKMVTIQVGESGRSNPFLPAAENVPASSLPKFSLLSPPEQVSTGSDADNVMGTTISGILYDKYSPSAIITIGGTDYLVKRGDTINRYKILSISKEQVVVQLGKNIYRAGVGQILTQGGLNYNTISNLDRKFAGNSVKGRKKGY